VSAVSHFGQPCTCPAKARTCNLTDCQQPWARKYRKSVQPSWLDRIVGAIVALFMGGKP
jgi:hypothetical protein